MYVFFCCGIKTVGDKRGQRLANWFGCGIKSNVCMYGECRLKKVRQVKVKREKKTGNGKRKEKIGGTSVTGKVERERK